MDCCSSTAWDQTFTRRFARSLRRGYERRGLSAHARPMVDLITDRGIDGATVLEVGGGVGDIQVELLRRGARRATSLELSRSYEAEALALLDRYGLQDRVMRLVVDLANDPEAVEPAEVVVLHRVVCCYPDAAGLLAAAAGRTRRILAYSHPPSTPLMRALVGVINGWQRLRRRGYRAYVHSPAEMCRVVESAGLRQAALHRGMFWSTWLFERPGAEAGIVARRAAATIDRGSPRADTETAYLEMRTRHDDAVTR